MTWPQGPGRPGQRGPGGGVCLPPLLLVLSLLALLQPLLVSGAACLAKDVMTVQQGCRKEIFDFDEAKKGGDSELLCKSMLAQWFCVATKAPRCFHNFTAIDQKFTHSPYNCKPTVEDLQRLQTLVHSGSGKEEVTVDVVSLTSTTPDYVTKAEDEVDDATKSRDSQVGDSSKHQGNGAGQLTGCATSVWLLLPTLVFLRLQA